jgi:hypothetical protein
MEYPSTMTLWIILLLAAVLGGVWLVVSRLWHSARGNAQPDLGEVSQSWITQHRAEKW